MFKKKTVYVISCELNSSSQYNSYILGTFTNLNVAKTVAGNHYFDRAGKYKVTIYKCKLNTPDLCGCEIVYEINR